MTPSPTDIERARQRYINAVKRCRVSYKKFVARAIKSREARSAFLKAPTRANRKSMFHARKMRAQGLRSFRRDRVEREAAKVDYLRLKRIRNAPLREKALEEARKLIGVMEHGGNNAGADVAKIIRGGGGNPAARPAWCGYFNAYCYRLAGSKAVNWMWAAVRLLAGVSGIKRVENPLPGDMVRFTFDHTGLFEKDNGDGTITTIEGNTGVSGAVSDSKTGGDGVYRKVRHKSLVSDYLRVTK